MLCKNALKQGVLVLENLNEDARKNQLCYESVCMLYRCLYYVLEPIVNPNLIDDLLACLLTRSYLNDKLKLSV